MGGLGTRASVPGKRKRAGAGQGLPRAPSLTDSSCGGRIHPPTLAPGPGGQDPPLAPTAPLPHRPEPRPALPPPATRRLWRAGGWRAQIYRTREPRRGQGRAGALGVRPRWRKGLLRRFNLPRSGPSSVSGEGKDTRRGLRGDFRVHHWPRWTHRSRSPKSGSTSPS